MKPPKVSLSTIAIAAVALTLTVAAAAAQPGQWLPVGDMNVTRSNQSATLLLDGRVLVIGGYQTGLTKTAELYDPVTQTFTPTGSPLTHPRCLRGPPARRSRPGRWRKMLFSDWRGECRNLQSRHRHVFDHRQPQPGAGRPHADASSERQGAAGGGRPRGVPEQRGAF